MCHRIISWLLAALLSVAGVHAAPQPNTIRGNAVLKVGATSHLYLFVQSEDAVRTAIRDAIREATGRVATTPRVQPGVDHAFILASDQAIVGPDILDLDNAVISVNPGRVVVTSAAARTVVILALADAQEPAGEQFPAGYVVLRFSGFGLTHKTGTTGTTLQKARVFVARSQCEEVDPYCVENIDPGGGGNAAGSCGSGGTGATACSCTAGDSGCSVSCSLGYYACCNCGLFGNTCQCIRQ